MSVGWEYHLIPSLFFCFQTELIYYTWKAFFCLWNNFRLIRPTVLHFLVSRPSIALQLLRNPCEVLLLLLMSSVFKTSKLRKSHLFQNSNSCLKPQILSLITNSWLFPWSDKLISCMYPTLNKMICSQMHFQAKNVSAMKKLVELNIVVQTHFLEIIIPPSYAAICFLWISYLISQNT